MNDAEKFEGWCVVEVMGHHRYAGHVMETQLAGAGMLRIDVPASEADEHGPAVAAFTKFIAPGSLYGVTPVSEEYARQAARALRKEPVEIYMPQLYPRTPARPALSTPENDPDYDF